MSDRYAGLLLNMQMLVDEMEELYCDLKFFGSKDEQRLVGVRLYHGQKSLNSQYVYLGLAEDFDAAPPETGVFTITIGELAEERSPSIELRPSTNMMEVFEFVQDIFDKYRRWDARLNDIVQSGGGLYELLVAAIDLLNNPLYIHDAQFTILARPIYVQGMMKADVDEETGYLSTPIWRVNQFRVSQEYLKTLDTVGGQLWFPRGNQYRVLYANIRSDNNEYLGRMCVNELISALKPGHFRAVEHVVKFAVYIIEYRMASTGVRRDFEDFVFDVADSKVKDNSVILHRIDLAGWNRENRYMCAIGKLPDRELDLRVAQKVCSAIRMSVPGSMVSSIENIIRIAINLTTCELTEEMFVEKIQHLARETLFKVGFSNVFEDFLLIGDFIKQANVALSMGTALRADDFYYRFQDYVSAYMAQNCIGELPALAVCSPELLRLQAIDEERGTSYVETLRVYLNSHCRILPTARQLFIHRSTLTYRLERIAEITQLDLENPDTVFYLHISYRMLDYC